MQRQQDLDGVEVPQETSAGLFGLEKLCLMTSLLEPENYSPSTK